MFLLDKLVTLPASGLLWIVEELMEAAQKERAEEGEAIRGELRELYLQLEQGAIDEASFSAQESVLLDRLDAWEAQQEAEGADDGADDDADEDDEVEGDDDGYGDGEGDDGDDHTVEGDDARADNVGGHAGRLADGPRPEDDDELQEVK